MKLNPPKLDIRENAPFEGALFGREEFAKSLTELLRNASENIAIFVNAPWGEGKTTFSEMWRAYLRKEKIDVIYFDAYAADYCDDPFVAFSGEILHLVDKHLANGKELAERREFKKTAVEVGKRLVVMVTKVGIRAATMGVVETEDLETFQDIGSEIATEAAEIGSDVIEKKLENYAAEKDALISFKVSLAKLAAKFRAEQKFPLTIIVDELDRCRPDFALALLERMKHLFDVQDVAFIFLVHRAQIESYIQAVYGDGVEARAYLLKFGTLFIDLPQKPKGDSGFIYVTGHKEFCDRLLHHYGICKGGTDYQYLLTCIELLAGHFNLTLREIEKVFTFLSIYYSSLPQDQSISVNPAVVLLVVLLAVVKVTRPVLYDTLSKGNISTEEFYRQSTLREIKVKSTQAFDVGFAKDALDYCLMSDLEYEVATKSEDGGKMARPGIKHIENRLGSRRKEIIPFLCNQLDRFSLQPN